MKAPSLFPESVRNIIESANCTTRIILKACQGTERTVEGLDEVTTLLLSQQRQRLLSEITNNNEAIDVTPAQLASP